MGVERSGYIEPGVRVYQIIEGVNAPLSDVPLNPILVGACYKVVDRERISPPGFPELNTLNSVHADWLALPSMPPGAVLLHDSVTLFITGEARVCEIPYVNVIAVAKDHRSISVTRAYAENIKGGDRLEQTKDNITTSYYVDYVDNEKAGNTIDIHLKGDIDLKNAELKVYRKYEEHPIKQGFRVASSDMIELDGVLKAQGVYEFTGAGDVSVSYVAQRKDIVGRHKIGSLKELTELMETNIQNVIGFLAARCISAGNVVYLHVTGEEGADAVQEAVESLQGIGIYYLVPTIGGADIAKTYMSFVVSKTRPEIGEFMMAMVSPADGVVTQETIASLDTGE